MQVGRPGVGAVLALLESSAWFHHLLVVWFGCRQADGHDRASHIQREDLMGPLYLQDSPFFQQYELDLREPALGQGSFSVCRRCRQRQSGQEFAVKILSRRWETVGAGCGQSPPERARDKGPAGHCNPSCLLPRLEENTQREVAALRLCQSHPNVVNLHEVLHDQVTNAC